MTDQPHDLRIRGCSVSRAPSGQTLSLRRHRQHQKAQAIETTQIGAIIKIGLWMSIYRWIDEEGTADASRLACSAWYFWEETP